MINNVDLPDGTRISSGSLAEGLDLPGSDQDVMFVKYNVRVLRNIRNIKHPIRYTTLVMESDTDHPGFTKLRLLAEDDVESRGLTSKCVESTRNGAYLSVNGFIDEASKAIPDTYLHSPCLSTEDQAVDIAICLKSTYFLYQAIPWSYRHRNQWPTYNVIDRIFNYGCLLVPIGPKNISDSHLLWRFSFSVAEKQLVHSFNFTQLLCYGLLKLILKSSINTNEDVKDLLCSYFLKTAVFWVSEEMNINTFQLPKLYFCLSLCLNKLMLWVHNCYCPNYFIPEHNMFLGKITTDNNELLLQVLNSILLGKIDGLITKIFPFESGNYHLLRTKSANSFNLLDILYFRIYQIATETNISDCYKALTLTESIIKSESSAFIIDVCKYHYAKISQCAAQLLPSANTTGVTYNMHKRYQRHLQDGLKTDAVSGWLLYASLYYVIGHYTVTLRLTDYVLSRSTSDMVYISCPTYDEEDINNYRQNVCNSVTLNARIKNATVKCVTYVKNSSFIPLELQLEVEKGDIDIPPIFMSHCLRFLCYHHLGDHLNKEQALRDLDFTVKKCILIKMKELSDLLTILGVCYEISDDKETAYQCYNEALKFDYVCLSAETRKSKLFEVLYQLHRCSENFL
ncbi:uncharacterized protein LOC127723808 [Mytilus californianus]|uniref:uncharacterized protein LOC127723808 n=1 Tax=Mytilus californianus TaxID=6549 RepID=UPI002247A1DB|nr:uncharacterized protein LOC127723808 [Mytilus californianus]